MMLGSTQRFAIQCELLLLPWLSGLVLHADQQTHQDSIELVRVNGQMPSRSGARSLESDLDMLDKGSNIYPGKYVFSLYPSR
jgi:hypothetical protein